MTYYFGSNTYFSISKSDLNTFSQNLAQVSSASNNSSTIISIVHCTITCCCILITTISEAGILEILPILIKNRDYSEHQKQNARNIFYYHIKTYLSLRYFGFPTYDSMLDALTSIGGKTILSLME